MKIEIFTLKTCKVAAENVSDSITRKKLGLLNKLNCLSIKHNGVNFVSRSFPEPLIN